MTILKSLRALREEDHRRALYASLVFIMLMILFFLLVSLEEPDPPLKEKIIPIEMEDIDIPEEFMEEPGGGGSQGDANPEYSEAVDPAEHVEVQHEVSVHQNSGNGNQVNNQVNNPKPDDGLTFGGDHGDDNGTNEGPGFGDGTGVNGGSNSGPGGDGVSNPNRKVVVEPTITGNAQEEGKIALDIWVDENGNVVQTRFKESKSTSASQYLISLAERAAKTMKYEKKPGAVKEHVGYQIFVFTKV